MASSPQFIATPKNGVAQVSVANTNRDGSGTLATVYTAGASGARIDMLAITAAATTTAGMLRFYVSDGSVNRLIRELPVVAVVPSATVPAFSVPSYLFEGGLVLQANWLLKASTHNAETFNITPTVAGDF